MFLIKNLIILLNQNLLFLFDFFHQLRYWMVSNHDGVYLSSEYNLFPLKFDKASPIILFNDKIYFIIHY